MPGPVNFAVGRIAMIDDDLDNYHTNLFLKLLRGSFRDRGFSVSGCSALKEKTGREWADGNGVAYYRDLAELDDATDYYMVLAPSTSETHLELCRRVIPFGKPVWVDKTFAPDLATAQMIFSLADARKIPLESSSALRYTSIQRHAHDAGRKAIRHMVAWGAGGKLEEYLVHPLEIVISCMGPEATRIMLRGAAPQIQLLLDFSGGRTAVVNLYLKTETPFAATITTGRGTRYIAVDEGQLFLDALTGVLGFFRARAPTFDRAETLAIRRIMDAALGQARTGEWIGL